MDKVLDAMHLPETISDALLGHGGIYAPFLDLARAVELPDVCEIARQSGQLGLGAMQVNRAQLEAIAFADRMEF
jgi:EAL and modified HD-GYP domain-containing signal transduction protein